MNNTPTNTNSISGRWLFLGLVLVVYIVTALLDSSLAIASLQLFGQTLVKIIPILILVFILILIFNLILSPQKIKTYLGASSGPRGWLLAVVGGIFSTGPIYAWYVLLSELRQKGMRISLMAVFLYARAIKLPLLPLLIHYFGLTYTLVLSFYLAVFAIISGIVTEFFVSHHSSQK
jgi:uncharacterized membrane protein YraQ (UPF0718 family)